MVPAYLSGGSESRKVCWSLGLSLGLLGGAVIGAYGANSIPGSISTVQTTTIDAPSAAASARGGSGGYTTFLPSP